MEDYWQIVNCKIYSVVKDGVHKKAWNGPNEEKYKQELSILRPHFRPVVWGFGSALAVFASFRASGSVRFMAAARSVFGWNRSSNRMMDNPTNSSNSQRLDKIATLQRGFSIPVDLFLSTLIGCSVSLFLTDPNKLKKDLERIPLVSGKSLVSDELCSDFIAQYQQYEKSDQIILDEALKNFIFNCQKRIDVETYLKKQKDNFDNEINSIPSSGVEYLWGQINRDGNDNPSK